MINVSRTQKRNTMCTLWKSVPSRKTHGTDDGRLYTMTVLVKAGTVKNEKITNTPILKGGCWRK
jgi:hypothetical protein